MDRDLEQLKALIRPIVVEVIADFEKRHHRNQVAPANADHRIIVLFCGIKPPSTEFYAQAALLATSGYQFLLIFSHSFRQAHDIREIEKQFPEASQILTDTENELAVAETVKTCSAIILPHLSPGTAAKVSHGIEDSVPSAIIAAALAQAKPIILASSVEETLSGFSTNTPPAFRQLAGRNLHALQGFGIRFGADAGNYLVNLLSPVVNETPERLARQRPPHKREFVTTEDIWNALAEGEKDLLHAHNAYITDEARELASARGVTLRARD